MARWEKKYTRSQTRLDNAVFWREKGNTSSNNKTLPRSRRSGCSTGILSFPVNWPVHLMPLQCKPQRNARNSKGSTFKLPAESPSASFNAPPGRNLEFEIWQARLLKNELWATCLPTDEIELARRRRVKSRESCSGRRASRSVRRYV